MKESILELLQEIKEGIAQSNLQKTEQAFRALEEIMLSEYTE